MARPCVVCGHPDRREIEKAFAKGATPSTISARFRNVSEGSVRRHMASHAVRSMEKAAIASGARDLATGLGLNEEIVELQDRTLTILAKAEKTAKTHTRALLAIREARANLELIAKLTHKLRPDATIEIHLHPEVVDLRNRLAEWLLAKHPAEVEELARLFEASKP